jgi:molybdopterin molybdotransferase
MIEVSEAENLINNCPINLPSIKVPLQRAFGRVLRQQICADDDMPSFDRVTMDGIAIRFDDWEKGNKSFVIEDLQAAGMPQKNLKTRNACMEVMTGAVMPLGADTVVPYEDIAIADGKAEVIIDSLSRGKNIHRRGTDRKVGDVLIEPGRLIGTPEIALIASNGVTEVKVTRFPRIAIISTGNELVEIDQQPLPHQIRKSNVYALAAELRRLGISSSMHHCNDDRESLNAQLTPILEAHDVLLLSGGVSMGKFDFIPEVLESLGVTQHFHRIRQKPGKPLWFGSKADKKVVFAFPGNPVSTFLCFHRYFIPWLHISLGNNHYLQHYAALSDDFKVITPLTYFLQATLYHDNNGRLMSKPIDGKGSGDHANLSSANAFLELPAGESLFKKGEMFKVFPYRAFI